MSTRPDSSKWPGFPGLSGLSGVALVLLGLLGCPASEPVARARCQTDGDCLEDSRCLFDLTLDEAYCARLCRSDLDCQPYETCEGRRSDPAAGAEDQICVDRIRECQPTERCNGLDDDCDETIDNAGCTVITGCTSDVVCGAFSCQAPEGQADTLCAPPNSAATAEPFAACQAPSDCSNNLCDHAFCSPVCDPLRPEFSCLPGQSCVEGLAGLGAPPHNTCATACRGDADCAGETACVWRKTAHTQDVHALVCSTPPPNRKPLGAACSGFRTGDDECESGLCFSCRCTRACLGDESCVDVTDGFRCIPRRLPYGLLEYSFRVCSTTVSVGACGGGS